MFHMLTCFNLKPEITIDEFRQSVRSFRDHMLSAELVQSIGQIGRRQRNTIMDTDHERDHQYFFITSFRDRVQCDRAVEYIFAHDEPADSIHDAVYSKVQDPIFICWEDIGDE